MDDVLRLARSIKSDVEDAKNEADRLRSYAMTDGAYTYSQLGDIERKLSSALSDVSRLIGLLK